MVILNWTAESVEVERDSGYETDVILCVNGDVVARKRDAWTGDDPDRVALVAIEMLCEMFRSIGGWA